ncbi:MAG: ABC transporter substrate-binding protein [Phycisphaerae bacterium]
MNSIGGGAGLKAACKDRRSKGTIDGTRSRYAFARHRTLRSHCVVAAAAAALLFAGLALGQDDQPPGSEGEAYGKTPDTVMPYRSFREPYARFFLKPTPFYGSGREHDPPVSPETARLGLLYPVGEAADADLGAEMLEGVKLALERANAEGGCNGIPFELIERHDVGLWGASSNEMVGFKYADDVLAVVGSIDGANTHIALRVALKTQMPIVNTGTTDPTLTETAIPWLLRCMADDRQQGYALAHHVFTECGIKKVAAFRVNDRFGRTGIGEFRDAARRLGHPLRVELRWERGDRDFSAQLERISHAKPEAIVLWGTASDAAAVVREIRKRQRSADDSLASVRIFGCDRLVSRTFLEEAGPAAEGVVAVASSDPTRNDPALKEFTEEFTRRFHHEPGTFAAHAFDGASILVAAMRKGGLNRARIRDELAAYTHYDGVTGPIEFDATLNDVGAVYIATVEGGKFIYREATFSEVARTSPDADTESTNKRSGISPGVGGASGPDGASRRRAHLDVPYRTIAASPPTVRSLHWAGSPTDGAPEASSGARRVGCFLPLDEAGRAAVRGLRMALVDDATRHPHDEPIELVVRDARGNWGGASSALVDLIFKDNVLAVISSTERRATHLAETLAAKIHFPVLTLCATDPTITRIPLPWIFRVASQKCLISPAFATRYKRESGLEADAFAAAGYDAGVLVASRIRDGAETRLDLRDALADGEWNEGVSGVYRFDPLGNRVDRSLPTAEGEPAVSLE